MPLRAALYLRISPGAQAEKGLSVPDERRHLRDHCAAMGWPVVAEFTDTHGGTGRNRPGFQAMMDAALHGAPLFDVIVVHSFRRFSRDEIESELAIRSLKNRGIELVSITQQFDDSACGEMVQRIIGLLDEYESKETGKHVSRAMAENARQGFFNGGIAPFGYRSVEVEKRGNTSKKKLQPREDEVKTVRLIFYLYLRGDGTTGPLGVKKIVEWLNDRSYRTRRGARWGIGPVHHLLTDPVYKGDYRQNSTTANEQLRVPVPAIVSNGVFDAVQRRIASGSPRSRRPHSGRP
jgi:DNA invertase Pin-like site-specific DNA recombinase